MRRNTTVVESLDFEEISTELDEAKEGRKLERDANKIKVDGRDKQVVVKTGLLDEKDGNKFIWNDTMCAADDMQQDDLTETEDMFINAPEKGETEYMYYTIKLSYEKKRTE